MLRRAEMSSLGDLAGPVQDWTQRFVDDDVARRLADRDATLWTDDPTVHALIANRLGWVGMSGAEVGPGLAAGDVLLLGMGGSSLGAEAVATAFDLDRLRVVDSTIPEAVRDSAARLDQVSDIVVASKSGGTLETAALARFFESEAPAGTRFHAVTDPGSDLERRASERGYAMTHTNPADIGGRFSVLSAFGAVPLSLAGIDVASVRREAAVAVEECGTDGEHNPGIWLGAVLAAAAATGRTNMVLVPAPGLEGLADWIEQLVAESTGKGGIGILPVVAPREMPLDRWRDDAFVVDLAWRDGEEHAALQDAGDVPVVRCALASPAEIGREFYVWQVATALVGRTLGINPFDEPNVAAAKQQTREILDQGEVGVLAEGNPQRWRVVDGDVADLRRLATSDGGSYVGVLAYLAPRAATRRAIVRLRTALWEGLPVTVGWGPRYLHSSGQFHKGGRVGGRFLVVTQTQEDLPVPGMAWTFGTIARAQALGDASALRAAGRDVVHLHVECGLDQVVDEILASLE